MAENLKPLQIRGMDKANAEAVRHRLEEVLVDRGLAIEGARVEIGRARYNPATASVEFSIEVTVPAEDGSQAPTQEALDWKFHRFQAEPDNTLRDHKPGDVFSTGGRRFRLTGWNRKARKRPVMAQEIGKDRTYVFPVEAFLPRHGVTWEVGNE